MVMVKMFVIGFLLRIMLKPLMLFFIMVNLEKLITLEALMSGKI